MEQMSLESILANLGVEPGKVRKNFPDKYKSFLHVLVETAPEIAYEAFRDAEDKEGLSEARRRLVETAPERAYEAFRDAEDKEGLSEARRRLVETVPEIAYEIFRDAEDKEGLSEARRRLVETAPEIAYRAFRDAEDKEGLRALATFIASQTGADTERLEKLFSDS